MEAIKCDRCGKYVDGRDMPTIRGWETEVARCVGTPTIKMDLCPECFEALQEFLSINKKPNACISCDYFRNKEYYVDNTINCAAVAYGSCVKCQRNITSTSPNTEVPSWCPLKEGDKNDKS